MGMIGERFIIEDTRMDRRRNTGLKKTKKERMGGRGKTLGRRNANKQYPPGH